MTRLFKLRLRAFIFLVIATALVGAASEAFEADIDDLDRITSMVESAVLWGIGAVLVWGFEILFVPSRFAAPLRQTNFLAVIAIKSVLVVTIFLAVYVIGQSVFDQAERLLFEDGAFYREFAAVSIAVVAIQVFIQSTSIVGERQYLYFLLGRYHRPVEERKVFMFLDLAGSTSLARWMGDLGVQRMITRFFRDIDEPIAEHRGEVHRYVGDQVVVTWRLSERGDNMDPIRCCFAIQARMEDLANEYQQEFGVVPSYRIGLHGGPVIISECGERRREISYFGDTVNTAARIEQACKPYGVDLLVSKGLTDWVRLDPGYTLTRVGSLELRGRDESTELFSLQRS